MHTINNVRGESIPLRRVKYYILHMKTFNIVLHFNYAISIAPEKESILSAIFI